MGRIIRAASGAVLGFLAMAQAVAFAAVPEPWQLGMQPPASPVKQMIGSFHDLLLVIITVIAVFVLGLLVVTMLRFRASRNPTPSRVTHNTFLEIAWTAIPVLILVIVAIPSFKLLYFMDRTQEAEMTIKVTGRQWYWSYEYPDHDGLKFDSFMIQDEDLKPGQKRLLEVDNRLVLPVGANVRVLIGGSDVMHSWFLPALGVQTYAVPGRSNETWLRVDKAGVYYGQCNQICGINHAYMPIAIEAVPRPEFERWVQEATRRFADERDAGAALAAAESQQPTRPSDERQEGRP